MASDFARDVLQRLRGGLVASCQADEGSPLRAPVHIVAMANAAIMGGAVALRIEGIENIAAVRQAVDVPIIGIVKARVALRFGWWVGPPHGRSLGDLLPGRLPL